MLILKRGGTTFISVKNCSLAGKKDLRAPIVLLFLLILTLAKPLLAQHDVLSDSISIKIEEVTLISAIQKLSDHSGIRFAYRNTILTGKTVSPGIYTGEISEILDELIRANNLCYSLQGKQVIIHTACIPKYYYVSGTVFEDSSLRPIPYISVGLKGQSIGTIADKNGYFEFNIPYSQQKKDTILFSSLGFKRDTLIIDAGKAENLTLLMQAKAYAVAPVLVRPINFVRKIIGNTKDRSSGSLYLDTHGQQTALFIPNKGFKHGELKTVKYYLSKKGNSEAPFRVRIYDVDTLGLPGTDLIEDAVVVKPKHAGGWYSVDLSMLSLMIPEKGIFISIEGVFPDDYQDYFGSTEFIDLADKNKNLNTLTYGQRIGYNRHGRKSTWHYSINKVWFQLEKQNFGVMIAAVIKYEKEKANDKKKSINR